MRSRRRLSSELTWLSRAAAVANREGSRSMKTLTTTGSSASTSASERRTSSLSCVTRIPRDYPREPAPRRDTAISGHARGCASPRIRPGAMGDDAATLLTLLRREGHTGAAVRLADDVVFHSPVADYVGRDDVLHLLLTIASVLEDVRVTRSIAN